MNHGEFREQLRARLIAQGEKVLLRVAMSPDVDRPIEFTGPQILAEAEKLADRHVQGSRQVVLLLLPHSPELFLLHLGLVLRGHVPAILAWPTSRIDPEKYQRNLVHQLGNLPADKLLTLPQLAENLSPSLPYAISGVETANRALYEKLFPAGAVLERLESTTTSGKTTRPSDQALFLQFSGGTTGAQKAIVVTGEMLIAQLSRLASFLQFGPQDGVASWLPMYHDMGLIACLWMPLWHGAPSLQMAANDWVLNPELLFRFVSRYRPTFSWLPNFSFSYLAQRRQQMKAQHDLSSMRAWINCSEPVRLKSMSQFADAFADWGVPRQSLQTCYAMAETVFAITQSRVGSEPRSVRRRDVQHPGRGYTDLAFDLVDDIYVSSGNAIADTELRVVTSKEEVCPEMTAGEILVRTPSLFSGYWGSEGFRTHTLEDGWHATGDYGFLSGGELFVIGRQKDIVIVGGQNVFPEDVEAVVNTISGIHAGRVVAFGVEDADLGTQSLVVVAEVENHNEEVEREAGLAIRNLVLAAIGIAPRYVRVVPRNWIVKSTAGKISRKETRERWMRERVAAATS